MKIFKFFLAFLPFSITTIIGQSFEEAFNQQHLVNDPSGFANSTTSGLDLNNNQIYTIDCANGTGTFQTITGPTLQGFLTMYKATNSINYLNSFVQICQNIQDRRDDRILSTGLADNTFRATLNAQPSEYVIYTPGSSLQRPNAKTWSGFVLHSGHWVWYASGVYTGEILYPMVNFIHLVKVEKTQIGAYSCPLSNFNTMLDYANWLEDEVWYTFQEHFDASYNHGDYNYPRDVWKNINGTTGFFKGLEPDYLVESNYAIALGRCFAVYYDFTNDSTRKSVLLNVLRQLKVNWFIHAEMTSVSSTNGWKWDHTQYFPSKQNTYKEDISHGYFASQMVLHCREYGITDSDGTLLYSDNFTYSLVNTFTRQLYNAPLFMFGAVDGTNVGCPICSGDNSSPIEMANRRAGLWLPLSHSGLYYSSSSDYIDRDMFNICKDILTYYFYAYPAGDHGAGLLALEYAYLTYYQNQDALLEPVATNRSPGNGSYWAGVDCGDMDGDGKQDIVTVRNSTVGDNVLLFDVETNTTYSYLQEINQFGGLNTSQYGYEDVAVGNFKGGGKFTTPNQAIAITNSSGNLYMFEYQSGSVNQTMAYTAPSASSQWKGICAGNFDKSTSSDEIVAVRNMDGKFHMMKYDLTSNSLVTIMSWTVPISNPNWGGVASGDLDNDGYKDDIVAVENSQGNIYVFYYDDTQGTMIQGPIYTATNSSSNFTDVTCGRFCSPNQLQGDDIVVQRGLDGDMTLFRIYNGGLVSYGNSYFTSGQNMDILGSGNVYTANSKDELISLRNYDGDMFVHNVTLSCQVPAPKRLKSNSINYNNTVKSSDIYISPNPSDHTIKINGLLGSLTIEIYTISGVKVMSSHISELNIVDLPSGLYIVKAKDDLGIHLSRFVRK